MLHNVTEQIGMCIELEWSILSWIPGAFRKPNLKENTVYFPKLRQFITWRKNTPNTMCSRIEKKNSQIQWMLKNDEPKTRLALKSNLKCFLSVFCRTEILLGVLVVLALSIVLLSCNHILVLTRGSWYGKNFWRSFLQHF